MARAVYTSEDAARDAKHETRDSEDADMFVANRTAMREFERENPA